MTSIDIIRSPHLQEIFSMPWRRLVFDVHRSCGASIGSLLDTSLGSDFVCKLFSAAFSGADGSMQVVDAIKALAPFNLHGHCRCY